MIRAFFNPRTPSLLRANLVVLGSLAIAFLIARFPQNHPSPAMIFPILAAAAGMADAFRCIRMQWSWYHGAVMVSLYMDAMVLTMILFLAIYPLLARIG